MVMENTHEAQQLRQYLTEAVEMLDDLRPKLALFEKQRYFRFKVALHNYCGQDAGLRNALAEAGVSNAGKR
jgi:hypothetical protein